MSLTKEKCKRALRELKMANDYPTSKFNDSRLIDFHLVTFEQLIEEHFDNQPLKFEELKEGIWVWDNKKKEYIKCNPGINSLNELCASYWYTYYNIDGELEEDYIEFEENRFYRKEVKDEH